MRSPLLASFIALAFVGSPFTGTFAHAWCGTDVVIIKGRVEHTPRSARVSVRVQLVYPKQKRGESGEVTVENGKFTIQIPFLTQSRAPVLIGNLMEKCDRKPKNVVVTLIEADRNQEYDRVSLDLAKDFKMADPSAYSPRSEIVLSGPTDF
jgi:hypothetical protein